MDTARCKGELGKWVSCKGAWEFYDWLSHASCFWAGHMASLNKNMDSNREEQKGNGYWEATNDIYPTGTFGLNINKNILYLLIIKLT